MQATQQQRMAETMPREEAVRLESVLDALLEKAEQARGQIAIGKDGGVEFGDFAGVQRYAKVFVEAGCVPEYRDDDYHKKLARTTISIMLGRRVGIPPEEAIACIYVINNRPTMFGDMPLALCRQHKKWVEAGFKEYFEVDGKVIFGAPPPEAFQKDTTAAVCETLREGASAPRVSRFSVAMAKQARLLGERGGKPSLYTFYPQRMYMFRARGYCLRDNFSDALRGIGIRELEDEQPEEVKPAEPPTGRISLRKPAANGEHATNGGQAATNPVNPPPTPSPEIGGQPSGDPSSTGSTLSPGTATRKKPTKKEQAASVQQAEPRMITEAQKSALLELEIQASEQSAPWAMRMAMSKTGKEDLATLTEEEAKVVRGEMLRMLDSMQRQPGEEERGPFEA